jgi:hypothetical protein
MPDEPTTNDPPDGPPEAPEPGSEPRKEPRREERREPAPAVPEVPTVEYCNRCHTAVRPGQMGSHLFHAHDIDRRQTADRKPKTTPKRKPAPSSPPSDEPEKEPAAATSRWADVRKSW